MPPRATRQTLDQRRLELLTTFANHLHALRLPDDFDENDEDNHPPYGYVEAQLFVNGNLVAAKLAVDAAKLSTQVSMNGQTVDVFANLMIHTDLVATATWHIVRQAIGFYTHRIADTGLVDVTSVRDLDITDSLRRALRPFFTKAPTSEKSVQDAVEHILRAQGIGYTREKDVAPVGPRGFRPDFVVASSELAIEVKLASKKHIASRIQEELTADIAGYGTRWRHLLAVVYDLGAIRDPAAFELENMKLFGVTVLVVKH